MSDAGLYTTVRARLGRFDGSLAVARLTIPQQQG